MEQVVARFLALLRVPVARHECEQLIRSHPDYPALVAVSDVLDSLGVNNYVAEFDEQELGEVAFPYLAHLKRPGGGDLALITNRADLEAARAVPGEWSGILVQADGLRIPASLGQTTRYRTARHLAVVCWAVAVAGGLLLLEPLLHLPGGLLAGHYLLALVGLAVGGLLFANSLGAATQLVEEFCGGGSQAGCEEVLEASPLQLFGLFTLSDAAIAYFAWQVGVLALATLASGLLPGAYSVLGLAALAGLPVVVFSVYYQYAVAKAWCRLCLLVGAVLLGQAALASYGFAYGDLTLVAAGLPALLLNLSIGLLVVCGMVVLVKQWGLRYRSAQQNEVELQRAKNSLPLFTSALLAQPRADLSAFDQEMVLGNPAAPLEIVLVSSLFCAPCKKAHEQLDRLVALFPDQLKVRFRLVISAMDAGRFPTATQHVLQYWLANIWGRPDESPRTAAMLHAWYETMDLDRFAVTHPADFSGDYALSTHLGTQHYLWVKHHRIGRTPTLYVNGHLLPAAYRLDDLKLLIPSLADFFGARETAAVPVHHAA